MIFDIVTIFPSFYKGPLGEAVFRIAREKDILEINIHNLRDYTEDKHNKVDDVPYGGGDGMVFKPEPLFKAVESIKEECEKDKFGVVLMSAKGRELKQETLDTFLNYDRLAVLCPRYKGVDERVRKRLIDYDVSIGKYILAGGDTAALVFMESLTRLIPGVLGNFDSARDDSFYDDQSLGPPLYTRPEEFRGMKVPDVLLSGNHKKIAEWREENRN